MSRVWLSLWFRLGRVQTARFSQASLSLYLRANLLRMLATCFRAALAIMSVEDTTSVAGQCL